MWPFHQAPSPMLGLDELPIFIPGLGGDERPHELPLCAPSHFHENREMHSPDDTFGQGWATASMEPHPIHPHLEGVAWNPFLQTGLLLSMEHFFRQISVPAVHCAKPSDPVGSGS